MRLEDQMWCSGKFWCESVLSRSYQIGNGSHATNSWIHKHYVPDRVGWGAVWLHGVLYWDVRGVYDMKIEIPKVNLIFTKSWKTNTPKKETVVWCVLGWCFLLWYGYVFSEITYQSRHVSMSGSRLQWGLPTPPGKRAEQTRARIRQPRPLQLVHGGHTVRRVCMPTLEFGNALAREGSRSAIRLRVDWCRS